MDAAGYHISWFLVHFRLDFDFYDIELDGHYHFWTHCLVGANTEKYVATNKQFYLHFVTKKFLKYLILPRLVR